MKPPRNVLYSFFQISLNVILPSSFSKRSHQNPVCVFLLSHACHMSRPCHLSWIDHPNSIWREVHNMKLFLFYSPCSFLNTLFSNIISLCFSLSVGDQVSYPQKNNKQNYKSSALNTANAVATKQTNWTNATHKTASSFSRVFDHAPTRRIVS